MMEQAVDVMMTSEGVIICPERGAD